MIRPDLDLLYSGGAHGLQKLTALSLMLVLQLTSCVTLGTFALVFSTAVLSFPNNLKIK